MLIPELDEFCLVGGNSFVSKIWSSYFGGFGFVWNHWGVKNMIQNKVK